MGWVRWLTIWLALVVGLGLIERAVLGPLLPDAFIWSGALVVGSALTLLVVRPPSEGD